MGRETRAIYGSGGAGIPVFPEGGPINVVTLAVAQGWVPLPVAVDCDLCRITVPSGGRRLLFTSDGAITGLTPGAAVTDAHKLRSITLAAGERVMGVECDPGFEFWFALDPTGGPATLTVEVTEAATVGAP